MRQLSLAAFSLNHHQVASAPSSPAHRWPRMQPARRLMASLSLLRFLHAHDTRPASDGASDGELERLSGPLGRLTPDDVRWELIGCASGGRRYRI